MSSGSSLHAVTLPPPAGTILLYAADGLSARQGDLSSAGRPRTPKRSIWVPLFRDYIETDEGLGTLHSLAKDGMTAWDCSSDQVNSLADAFVDISFRALSIAALEHFATTAHEKIIWHTKPTPITPEPNPSSEVPAATPATPSTSNKVKGSPQRPHERPSQRRFTP